MSKMHPFWWFLPVTLHKMLTACNSEDGGREIGPETYSQIGKIVVPTGKKIYVWAMGGYTLTVLGDCYVQVRDGVDGEVKKEVPFGNEEVQPSYEDGEPLISFAPSSGYVVFTIENKNTMNWYEAWAYVCFSIES